MPAVTAKPRKVQTSGAAPGSAKDTAATGKLAGVVRTRKATNVTINEVLLGEAKALCVNLSKAAEEGIARAVADRKAEQWLAENQEAIASSNAYVEKHGLPLAAHRMF